MTARELALDSFWTERPLVRLYIERTGADTFSLQQLIAFAESLPDSILQTMWGDTSQVPPRAHRADKETIQAAR